MSASKHAPGDWSDAALSRIARDLGTLPLTSSPLSDAAPDLLDMLTEIVTIARTGPHFAISGYSKQIEAARKLIERLKEAS